MRPIPAGRGRWRLLAYTRQFSTALPTVLGQLDGARGRRLEQKWNTAAQLTFTLDGHDPAAANLLELATDVVLYRWDETYGGGGDVCMFRGLLDHSEDQLSEQSAVVTFTAHDYFAMLSRRFSTAAVPSGWTATDQDSLVTYLVQYATDYLTSNSGVQFRPGNYLPLTVALYNPDGTGRGLSGQIRDRVYPPATVYGTAISDLANVQGGFDFDVRPGGPSQSRDVLRVFYPQQGVARSDMALVYGANVSTVTRTVSSADYANYVRVIGNKANTDPNAPQLFSERWNTDSNNVTVNPVGLFMLTENASDVSVQATLDQKAGGDLAWYGLLTPSYTIGLRPGTYSYGNPNMGDTVPVVITEGRLNVNTTVRVVAIDYSIGDDGQEDVMLTVGRPPVTMAKLLTGAARDIDALARR